MASLFECRRQEQDLALGYVLLFVSVVDIAERGRACFIDGEIDMTVLVLQYNSSISVTTGAHNTDTRVILILTM